MINTSVVRHGPAMIGWMGALCLAMYGCGDVDPTPVRRLETNPYLTLRLNTHSVTMSTVAPYDTLSLSAIPYDAAGAVLATSGTVTFTPSDTSVKVSAAGIVRAISATANAFVVAKLQDPATGITQYDTVTIVVTNSTPTSPLTTFAIQRGVGARRQLGATTSGYPLDTVVVAATNGVGDDITSDLMLRFSSSDPSIVSVTSDGIVMGLQRGSATITVSTTYYGVTKSDSISFTVGNPQMVNLTLMKTGKLASDGSPVYGFAPTTITVAVGGTVRFLPTFFEPTDIVLDVVFDDPSSAVASILPLTVTQSGTGTGNIPSFTPPPADDILNCYDWDHFEYGPLYCQFARAFNAPGTYRYHSAHYGIAGTIIVRDD